MHACPFVSVVMCFYKERIDWLRQSIDSILEQTYSYFEFIIICDNPSYQEGLALLKEYQDCDSRIKLIINEENKGLTKSLNIGLEKAKGEYVIRMDADDISFPERIEEQVKFMEANPQVVASGTSAYFFDDNKERKVIRETSSNKLKALLIFDSPIFHPTAIFRRLVDGKPVRYNEDIKFSQDYALWISLVSGHKLSNIAKPLVKYRISNEQISALKIEEQKQCTALCQEMALKQLPFYLSLEQVELMHVLTIWQEKKRDICDINRFVLDFSKALKQTGDIDNKTMWHRFILFYANYLPKHMDMKSALRNYIKVAMLTKTLDLYSFLSMVIKYFRQ